jgi:hypothetical protein
LKSSDYEPHRTVDVETSFDARSGIISTKVGEFHAAVLRTQDKQIREALIAMGWTPPPDPPKP